MTELAALSPQHRNPDVLTCIANLSSDEVFTPPELANRMLDLVAAAWAEAHTGDNIWRNSKLRFIDPFTKSGVFLREITSRLADGLKDEIPDLEDRIDHILTKQVFGIGITNLTSLIARRSVYCSKHANGRHSIAKSFTTADGNVWFGSIDHTWQGATEYVETANAAGIPIRKGINGKCKYCGASQKSLDRENGLETHAYAFIHTDNVKARINQLFGEKMQFDVVIGNPPYQLSDGGHQASATPIYQKFIEQAIALDPRFVVMVTPSRWFGGGRGLDGFRSRMLADRHMRAITDYIVEKDAFPGVNINGGVNYFLWDRDNEGDCTVTTIAAGGKSGVSVKRPLNEFPVFVRRNEAIPILRKVHGKGEATFDKYVSSLKPFGLRTHFHGASVPSKNKPLKLYGSGAVSWISRDEVLANRKWIEDWKVLIAAATDGNENYPLPIWDHAGPFVAGPGEICSETYLVAARTASEEEARHVVSYMRTKFFRFLVSLRKVAQHNKAENFAFVPALSMDRDWTDLELYTRYEINEDEIDFIDTMIRDMEFTNG